MTREPYATERVRDEDFKHLVVSICQHPHMFVLSETDIFAAVHAYISGFNEGRGGAPLMGFQQWLVVRANGANNIIWPGTGRCDLDKPTGSKTDEELVKALGALIVEFLDYRHEQGLTKIFRDYGTWLLRHSWYDGPLRRSPQP